MKTFRGVFFPGYFSVSEKQIPSVLRRLEPAITEQFGRVLTRRHPLSVTKAKQKARHLTKDFLAQIPKIKKNLLGDVEAAYEGDPAASGLDEVILCYPGILALTHYRLAHELYRLGVPLIPRMITEAAHGLTGIDIHPEAQIGERCFIDHGTGVVIGQTTIIGKRVRLYQGVTLGAKSIPSGSAGKKLRGQGRHPIIEDDVVIYSGATILGRITIGKGAIVGGNVWLTESVPAGQIVMQSPVRQENFSAGAGI